MAMVMVEVVVEVEKREKNRKRRGSQRLRRSVMRSPKRRWRKAPRRPGSTDETQCSSLGRRRQLKRRRSRR